MLSPSAYADRQSLHGRLTVLRIVAILCFVLLAASFWLLQVVQNRKYEEMAENNFRRTIPLRAPRGILFDRDNRVLVQSKDSYAETTSPRSAAWSGPASRRVISAFSR
jgi:penicillin-binding protein 2